MSGVQVKICGLTRHTDAALAAVSGAHFGGVILAPGGRRSISPDQAATVFEGTPLTRVGVFVDEPLDSLREAAERVKLRVIQLHGDESPEIAAELRAEGRWQIWKALRPRSAEELLEGLDHYQDAVDGLLLDGWSPEAPGGTGSRFPWEEVAEHRDAMDGALTFAVAGGLKPDNIARVIHLLRPDIVDVSSGVEDAPGIKNPSIVADFMAAVRAARRDPFRDT